jgi:hypothetical protein
LFYGGNDSRSSVSPSAPADSSARFRDAFAPPRDAQGRRVKPKTQPMDDQKTADLLYGSDDSVAGVYRSSLSDSINRLRDAYGLTSAQANERLVEDAHFFRDAQISTAQAPRLHSLLAAHELKPASDEQRETWGAETMRLVREKYGDGAEPRLEAVRTFLENRPAIAQRLTESGVGSHPDMVLALIENWSKLESAPSRW